MKLFRFALNIWITLASLGSFFIGWVALAHSAKPVQPTTSQQAPAISAPAIPTLAPLQDLQTGSNGNNFQNFQVQIPQQNFNTAPQQPLFQTGGS